MAIWVFPASTVTWAAVPPEPPKPVVVPLVMLFLLLTSEELHPIKPKSATTINKKREIKENDLLGMGLIPN